MVHFKPAIVHQTNKITGITYANQSVPYWDKEKKQYFPETHRQILPVAYYLSRFPRQAALHKHPFGRDIPSQKSSELFASITEEARTQFFIRQGKSRIEQEYWAYEITSISSYSNALAQIRYGF